MKARVIKGFFDKDAGKAREVGELFECSKERFEQLTKSRWGVLVAEAKKKKPEVEE